MGNSIGLKTTAIVLALSLLLALTGCKSTDTNETDAGAKDSASSAEESITEGAGDSAGDEAAGKTLEIGDKAATGKLKEFTVEKITVVDSLSAGEATKLLQIGAPGESPDPPTVAAEGSELLMVTFAFTSDEEGSNVRPADTLLRNSDGTEYSEVTTGGHGGIFNHDPAPAGEETKVTAVYEVPVGETGLTLDYSAFGEEPLSYSIR